MSSIWCFVFSQLLFYWRLTFIFSFLLFIYFFNLSFDFHYYSKSNEIERLKDEKPSVHTIILDFSSVFFIDSTGCETIVEVIEELDEFNIKVILCQCSQSVIQVLEKMNFFSKVMSPNICATVHDAVVQNDSTIAWKKTIYLLFIIKDFFCDENKRLFLCENQSIDSFIV